MLASFQKMDWMLFQLEFDLLVHWRWVLLSVQKLNWVLLQLDLLVNWNWALVTFYRMEWLSFYLDFDLLSQSLLGLWLQKQPRLSQPQ